MLGNKPGQEPEPTRTQDTTHDKPKKRQKIAVACLACRGRKVKCDGIRPVCGVCSRRKVNGLSSNCSYGDESDGTPMASRWRSYASESQHPISQQSPSRPIGQPFSLHDPHSAVLDVFDRSGSIRSSGITSEISNEMRSGILNSDFPSVVESSRGGISDKSKGFDSMTGVIGEQTHGVEFFGSSSAGSFTRQIKSAIDAKVGSTTRRPSFSGTAKGQLLSSLSANHNDEGPVASIQYTLPSRKTADSMISVYWELVHPLYPFLDREMFQKAYESIWTGSTSVRDERILMCTVNVMFALACQLSESIKPEYREESSKSYFKRAQELLQLDLWDVGSTELIQCLLIMGQYLQSTNAPHQCWMIIGHAIRIAQGLGFHLPEPSVEFSSRHDRQFSRVIWHGCVLMDRVLAMTFGRPAMISKSLADAVPLPEMVGYEGLSRRESHPHLHPSNQPSMMAFFLESLHLYNIMNDILLALYTDTDQNKSKKLDESTTSQNSYESLDLPQILSLDHALMMWSQNLPSHLQISSDEHADNGIFQRQAIVCRARFLHARILLFRPAFSRFCLPGNRNPIPSTALDESLAQLMVFQCSTLCVKAAHDIIQLIHSNLVLDNLNGPVPAWWYCILYVYTAATILLAARLQPTLNSGTADPSISTSWDHAIQVLRAFERVGQSAQRCVAALEILSAKVSKGLLNEGKHTQTSHHQTGPLGSDPPFISLETNLNEFPENFNFDDFQIDLIDMSWLNTLPGSLC